MPDKTDLVKLIETGYAPFFDGNTENGFICEVMDEIGNSIRFGPAEIGTVIRQTLEAIDNEDI